MAQCEAAAAAPEGGEVAGLVADHGNTQRLKHLKGFRQIEECLGARTHHDDRMARHRTKIG